MDRDISDFIALQLLIEKAESNPEKIGEIMLRAYWLGQGENINTVLKEPISKKPVLKLIG